MPLGKTPEYIQERIAKTYLHLSLSKILRERNKHPIFEVNACLEHETS